MATNYSRDQLLSLRHTPVLLGRQPCLLVTQLGLRRRGCRAGKHCRTHLLSSSGRRPTATACESSTASNHSAMVINNHQLFQSQRDTDKSSSPDVHAATRWKCGSPAMSPSDVRHEERRQSSSSSPLLSPTTSVDVVDMGLLSTSVSQLGSPLSLVSAASEPLVACNSCNSTCMSMNLSIVSDESSDGCIGHNVADKCSIDTATDPSDGCDRHYTSNCGMSSAS